MGTSFRPYLQDQAGFWERNPRDDLRKNHEAFHVSDIVDRLDLRAFYAPYLGDGRRNQPYDPRMMLKVLIFAYLKGVFSSRQMAELVREHSAYRWLAAGNFPNFRTLCAFRRRHLKDFPALFVEVARTAQRMGLTKLGRISLDGTKVRANASKRKAMSYERMVEEEKRLREVIRGLLAEAEAADVAEDAQYGEGAGGDGPPEELADCRARLAALEQARKELEAEQRARDDARGRRPGQKRNPKGGVPYKRRYGEPKPTAQRNFTDPESRIMQTGTEGFQQSYNAQAAVEGGSQLVVAATVTDNASDQGQLIDMIEETERVCGETPEQVLADAGYNNERDLRELERRGIDGYVALGREGGRPVKVNSKACPARARMAAKLATEEGRRRYARRKWQAEAPIGWIKEAMGFRRFSVRGLENVQGEWALVCLALNVKRLHTLQAA